MSDEKSKWQLQMDREAELRIEMAEIQAAEWRADHAVFERRRDARDRLTDAQTADHESSVILHRRELVASLDRNTAALERVATAIEKAAASREV